MHGRRADAVFAVLFTVLTVVQLTVLRFTPLALAPDEAHYWEWSRHLDISYYSKGPFVAWVIAASTALFGDAQWAVRLPSAFCYALFSLLFYLFVRSLYSAAAALLAWIALRSMLIFAQSGYLMTTDAPAVLFWLAALFCGYQAVIKERKWYWVPFGAAVGIGIWAKYTVGIIYPSVILFLLTVPRLRRQLWSKQFLLGLLTGAVFVLPLLFWNSIHGWANFAHNSGHLVRASGLRFRPKFLAELIGGQASLVGPLLFCGMIYAFWRSISTEKKDDLYLRYLNFSCLPLGFLVVIVSLFKRVYANWPMPIYVSGLLVLAHLICTDREVQKKLRPWIKPSIGLSLLITIIAHGPLAGMTFGLSGELLPTKKLVGWEELGRKVGEVLAARGTARPYFIVTGDYGTASEISYYTPAHPFVYCTNLGWRRMNQYDIWTQEADWQALRGQDALIVLKDTPNIKELQSQFNELVPITPEPLLQSVYGGTVIRQYYFYWGKTFSGNPPASPQAR